MNGTGAPRVLCTSPEIKLFLESYYEVVCTLEEDPHHLAEQAATSDALVLGDCPRTFFDCYPGSLESLMAVVRRGVSLLCYGGRDSYGAGGYGGSPLTDVLPFEIQDHDLRHLPRGVRIAEVEVEGSRRHPTRQIDCGYLPLPTSYNLPGALKRGASTILAKETWVGGARCSYRMPLVIFKHHRTHRVLCLTIPLTGAEARDLLVWERYPHFLRSCLQLLCQRTVSSVTIGLNPDPFRMFVRSLQETGGDTKERTILLLDALDRPFVSPQVERGKSVLDARRRTPAKIPIAQLQIIEDLAAPDQPEVAAAARQRMRPYLNPADSSYQQSEVEFYRHKARAAANQFHLAEAATLYSMAAITQESSKPAPGLDPRAWSRYFNRLARLCDAMWAAALSPVNVGVARVYCSQSLDHFRACAVDAGSGVPDHLRQVICLAEFIDVLLMWPQYCQLPRRIWPRTGRRKSGSRSTCGASLDPSTIEDLGDRLEKFSRTYGECAAWADGTFISLLREALELIAHFDAQRVEAFRSKIRAFEESGLVEHHHWRALFLHSIMDVFDETLSRSSWFSLLEDVGPWVEAGALLTLFAGAALALPTVQEWIRVSAANQMNQLSVTSSVSAGLLAVSLRMLRGMRRRKRRLVGME